MVKVGYMNPGITMRSGSSCSMCRATVVPKERLWCGPKVR